MNTNKTNAENLLSSITQNPQIPIYLKVCTIEKKDADGIRMVKSKGRQSSTHRFMTLPKPNTFNL